MTKKKQKFIWYYVLIGLGILIWTYSRFNGIKEEVTHVENIKIQLNSNIENVTGRRNIADYRFYGKEFKARFIILDGAVNSEHRQSISDLKKGDTINIKIGKSDLSKLNSNEDIRVYGIQVDNQILLSVIDYNSNRHKYSNRLNILFTFIGLLAILKGINISNKTKWIVFIGGIIFFIIARIFDVGY
ncbi:hypothetical protein [Aquimarina macrocephali]|uniref:hypothetical protein n=1 Tax=Aquimarina macrocephali TaxID=666563 RepID=UPI000465B5B5|nr:hypothetical protein [Aquimarina macrocephali]